MFKEWLKEFLAVILCAITLLYCFPSTTVFADGDPYKKDSTSESYTYYKVEGKSVKELFNFTIGTLVSGEVINWVFNFRSFTVIKEFTDDDGNTDYKVYFNTPNLQSIVKNQVISAINDGYTDSTYNVNETEWMVQVGPDVSKDDISKENAITKYGFAIPNYTYMGEYPKEVMTVAGIVPTNFWEGLWRAILAIFGVSYLKAPDASNFNTISYLNHQYKDSNDLVLTLFQEYYMPYFANNINSKHFGTPQDLINCTVTKEENDAAGEYIKTHKKEYDALSSKYDVWKKLTNPDGEKPYTEMVRITQFTLGKAYKRNKFEIANSLGDYAKDANVSVTTTINGTPVEDWLISSDNGRCERFAKLVREWKTQNASYNADKVITLLAKAYDINTPISSSDIDIVRMWYRASAIDANKTLASKIKITAESSKNTTTLADYVADYYNDKKEVDDLDTPEKDEVHPSVLYDSDTAKLSVDGVTETVTISEFLNFLEGMSLFGGFNGLLLSDFLTEDELLLYETYNKKTQVQEDYKTFTDLFGKDDHIVDKDHTVVGYSQCLIASEKDTECKSKAENGKEPTTISVASLYAYSGLYRITQKAQAEHRDKLTREEAMQVVAKIQNYCGPFYNEVLTNLITIMVTAAVGNGNTDIYKAVMTDDPRVMPFDVEQLPANDRANYGVTDPRVTLYKSHIIGGLVSNFTINMGFGIFIKPQQLIVNLGGKITEVSVFLQQMCSFDKLDELGLSPTKMWEDAFMTVLLVMLALFFIVKTVIAVVKMGTKSMAHLIIGFIILVLELGFVTAFAANPDGMWTNIKQAETAIISLGERTSTVANSPNTSYLFGKNKDEEVLYYIPYLDLWSKYNTGHGFGEDSQLLNNKTDEADLKGYETSSVQIGEEDAKHYSIILADAFSYYGKSTSVSNFVQEDGHMYNGPTINSNAYRVVDHFMAPRVKVTKSGDELKLNVTKNPNYNGEFQSGFFGLVCKLLNCALMCLLSIIKFFTFLWQWFLIYVLVFRVILGRGAEGKNWGIILMETFAPTLALVFIGLYAGVILQLGMLADGLMGIIFELCLFWVTFMILRWWKKLKQGMFFPKSLEWLYVLTNLKHKQRQVHQEQLRQTSENNAKDSGINMTEEELSNLDKRTEKLFNEDGTFKSEYNNSKYNKVYEDWYKFAKNSQNNGKELTQQEKTAMAQFETDDRYKDFAGAVSKYGTGKKLDKALNKKRKSDQSEDVWDEQVKNEKSKQSPDVRDIDKHQQNPEVRDVDKQQSNPDVRDVDKKQPNPDVRDVDKQNNNSDGPRNDERMDKWKRMSRDDDNNN